MRPLTSLTNRLKRLKRCADKVAQLIGGALQRNRRRRSEGHAVAARAVTFDAPRRAPFLRRPRPCYNLFWQVH